MSTGAVVVFVYSAVLLGTFGFSCYLMTKINPAPVRQQETSPPTKTAEKDTEATSGPDGRRSDNIEDTTCFLLSKVNVTIAPLITVTADNSTNSTTNGTAKERRSIPSLPPSGAQKPGLIIMEVTDDKGSPQLEIVIYPKRFLQRRIWREMHVEKDFELQSEGTVTETVRKSIIKIMPDDTITLEESDEIMSADTRANLQAAISVNSSNSTIFAASATDGSETGEYAETQQRPPSDPANDIETNFTDTEMTIITESMTPVTELVSPDLEESLFTNNTENISETKNQMLIEEIQVVTSIVTIANGSDTEPPISIDIAVNSDIQYRNSKEANQSTFSDTERANQSTFVESIENSTVILTTEYSTSERDEVVLVSKETVPKDAPTGTEVLNTSTATSIGDAEGRLSINLTQTGLDSNDESLVTNSIFNDQ